MRKVIYKHIDPLIGAVARMIPYPNIITILGLIFAIILAIISKLSTNYVLILVLYVLSAVADIMDGAVARRLEKTSVKGSFLDSICDRISDILYVFVLLNIGILGIDELMLIIMGTYLISYTRAKAESLGISMESIGLMERAERTLVILIMIILKMILINVLLLKIITMLYIVLIYITVLQRLIFFLKKSS